MGVDAHISCRAGQRFPLAIGDVLLRLGISVLLCHAKIDNMDNVLRLARYLANQEVVGFDVTVDEVLLVDSLNSGQLRTQVSVINPS